MKISAQLPPVLLTQTNSSIEALALAPDGTVEAKVLAQQPNGSTQVRIGGQLLNLMFPDPPNLGATLKLAVEKAEGQLRMTLVSSAPQTTTAAPSQATDSGATRITDMPATEVQLSNATLSSNGRSAQVQVRATSTSVAPTLAQTKPDMPSAQPQSTTTSQAGIGTSGPTHQPLAGPVATRTATSVAATQSSASAPVLAQNGPSPGPTPQVAAPVSAGPQASETLSVRNAVPYAVAAPVVATRPSMPSQSGALPLADAAVTQVAPTTPIGQNTGSMRQASQIASSATPIAPASSTPQAVLSQSVQRSIASQDSIVGLTSALAKVLGQVALPPPVVKAAQRILAQSVAIDGGKLDGAAVQRAVLASGVFQEALLASGQPKAASADLKAALLGMQRSLGAWLGDQPPIEKVSGLPPPLRGIRPRARITIEPAADMPSDPAEVGKVLQERTEAALSRVRLHQNASLPEPSQRNEAQWSLDLPVTVGGQQNMLQMQIHRDPDAVDTPREERGWQVRFAINLGDPGEVGAQISLRGRHTGVLLWADSPDTAVSLESNLAELREELEAVGLRVGSVLVRAGVPVAQAPQVPHVLDETR